jgi:hypothetical protein
MFALFVNMYSNLYYMYEREIKGICAERDNDGAIGRVVFGRVRAAFALKEGGRIWRMSSRNNP